MKLFSTNVKLKDLLWPVPKAVLIMTILLTFFTVASLSNIGGFILVALITGLPIWFLVLGYLIAKHATKVARQKGDTKAASIEPVLLLVLIDWLIMTSIGLIRAVLLGTHEECIDACTIASAEGTIQAAMLIFVAVFVLMLIGAIVGWLISFTAQKKGMGLSVVNNENATVKVWWPFAMILLSVFEIVEMFSYRQVDLIGVVLLDVVFCVLFAMATLWSVKEVARTSWVKFWKSVVVLIVSQIILMVIAAFMLKDSGLIKIVLPSTQRGELRKVDFMLLDILIVGSVTVIINGLTCLNDILKNKQK